MSRPSLPWIATVLFATASLGRAAAEEAPLTATLTDGSRLQGGEVSGWHQPDGQVKLDGQPLFDENKPARWLINHRLDLAERPQAYVEFATGDRLPGRVLEFRHGRDIPFEPLPAHLLVESPLRLNHPDRDGETPVRISTRWLKRVVWKRRTNPQYQPGTVFLRDGRQVSFRSLRWAAHAVHVLLEEGIRRITLQEIAELHLPRPAAWRSYYQQLAALTPNVDSRLINLETTTGARITTSRLRFHPGHHGNAGKTKNWYQRLQPAWSLDPFWIRYGTIRTWRFFSPEAVPLTLLPPVDVKQQSTFAAAWRPQLDRNVRQEPLRSGDREFGWGFGVHGQSELHFPLPPVAKSFRTVFGLDETVGQGGCVRASVALASSPNNHLFQSDLLTGSQTYVDTGTLSLSAADEDDRLILAVDAAHKNRPHGADPFDIRDSADWLAPQLHLDRKQLQREVQRNTIRNIPALAGWSPGQAITATNHWDSTRRYDPRYRLLLGSQPPFLRLRRELTVEPEHTWLAVAVSRWPDSPPARIQVRIAGRALGEFQVPQRSGPAGPPAALVPVKPFRGQTVTVELLQIPQKEPTFLDWQAVKLVNHRPGLLRIFEDERSFVQSLRAGEGVPKGQGEAALVHEDAHSAAAAMVVRPPGRGRRDLPGLQAVIREHPRLGEYRYLQFAWRKHGGQRIGVHLACRGQFLAEKNPLDEIADADRLQPRRPWKSSRQYGYRYTAGQQDEPPSRHLGNQPPQHWQVMTRDLYGDFGEFPLTGLAFECPDGQAGWFDHIYLARTRDDLQAIRPGAKPSGGKSSSESNIVRKVEDPRRFGLLLSRVAPLFSTAEVKQGIWLLREQAGKRNVVRTFPPSGDQPCVLRACLSLPADAKRVLNMTVGHEDGGDWRLEVTANGKSLHESPVAEKTTTDGWRSLSIDLSSYAGNKVLLEVRQHRGASSQAAAFWKGLRVAAP